jgi:hypothetical protein
MHLRMIDDPVSMARFIQDAWIVISSIELIVRKPELHGFLQDIFPNVQMKPFFVIVVW